MNMHVPCVQKDLNLLQVLINMEASSLFITQVEKEQRFLHVCIFLYPEQVITKKYIILQYKIFTIKI